MKNQKLLIAGGSGLVGTFLSQYFIKRGFEVSILSRSKKSDTNIKYYQWDINKGIIDEEALQADYIINLTGAGIMDQAWTAQRKKVLIDSRVLSNRLIAQGLKKMNAKPKVFISASATGIYGDRGDQELIEASSPGDDSFIVTCCTKWEEAAKEVESYCHKFCILRIGLVLTKKGGILEKFILPMKLGQANYFGRGTNYYSWIHIEDLAALFHQCMIDDSYMGVFNAVVPNSLTAKAFVKKVKQEIAWYALLLPIPKFIIRIFLGERADLLTNSTRVIPQKAIGLQHKFKFEDLNEAVADIMQRDI